MVFLQAIKAKTPPQTRPLDFTPLIDRVTKFYLSNQLDNSHKEQKIISFRL